MLLSIFTFSTALFAITTVKISIFNVRFFSATIEPLLPFQFVSSIALAIAYAFRSINLFSTVPKPSFCFLFIFFKLVASERYFFSSLLDLADL